MYSEYETLSQRLCLGHSSLCDSDTTCNLSVVVDRFKLHLCVTSTITIPNYGGGTERLSIVVNTYVLLLRLQLYGVDTNV